MAVPGFVLFQMIWWWLKCGLAHAVATTPSGPGQGATFVESRGRSDQRSGWSYGPAAGCRKEEGKGVMEEALKEGAKDRAERQWRRGGGPLAERGGRKVKEGQKESAGAET